ncbi:hypothetical protein V6N11_040519 [Hibiscus sabdariffa]|uniref:Uncharacterized protein n=1 Tax=Hibiscus sabdariffa TaxID=183260 RepID=A0ABR2RHQ5_9ROSI
MVGLCGADEPLAETVILVEDIVLEYVTDQIWHIRHKLSDQREESHRLKIFVSDSQVVSFHSKSNDDNRFESAGLAETKSVYRIALLSMQEGVEAS